MTRDLLLEIGVEEMPSAYMGRAIADLKQRRKNNLMMPASLIRKYTARYPAPAYPFVQDLEEKQPDAFSEIRGPKKSIAFDQEGNPTKAGLGFARSQKVELKDLEVQKLGESSIYL